MGCLVLTILLVVLIGVAGYMQLAGVYDFLGEWFGVYGVRLPDL